MTIMHASGSIESVRPLTNDERRASWAAKYFLLGCHRNPQKPRIRLQVTVPEPLRESSRAASAPVDANPSSRAAGLDDSGNPLPANPAAADAAHRPTGGPSYAARGGESVPRNYSTIEEWDAYYAGRAPKPEHPPF